MWRMIIVMVGMLFWGTLDAQEVVRVRTTEGDLEFIMPRRTVGSLGRVLEPERVVVPDKDYFQGANERSVGNFSHHISGPFWVGTYAFVDVKIKVGSLDKGEYIRSYSDDEFSDYAMGVYGSLTSSNQFKSSFSKLPGAFKSVGHVNRFSPDNEFTSGEYFNVKIFKENGFYFHVYVGIDEFSAGFKRRNRWLKGARKMQQEILASIRFYPSPVDVQSVEEDKRDHSKSADQDL